MPAKVAPADGRALPVSGSFKKGIWKPHISIMADVARMIDPEEMKERIKASWTTIGIVSALILTMTYPSILAPPAGPPGTDNPDIMDETIMMTFSTLNIISFVLALTIDILVVILMTQLDLCCSKRHTRAFLIKFSGINELLTGLFSLSIFILILQVMVITWRNYSIQVNIATMIMWGVMTVFGAILAIVITTFNRSKVVERGTALSNGTDVPDIDETDD